MPLRPDLRTREVSHRDGEDRGSKDRRMSLGRPAGLKRPSEGISASMPSRRQQGGRKEMGTESSLYKEFFLRAESTTSTCTSNTHLLPSPQLPPVQSLLPLHADPSAQRDLLPPLWPWQMPA